MKKIVTLLLFLVVVLIMAAAIGNTQKYFSINAGNSDQDSAAVFFTDSITVAELQNKYSSFKKVNILIVPGHEPDYGGTEYRHLKERDMVVDLANELAAYLRKNPHYNVTITRDKNAWNPVFQNYFTNNWNEIQKFKTEQFAEMSRLMSEGKVEKLTDGVIHNNAPQPVALRLFGINKWSNENEIDIALHLHFNDYPRKQRTTPGVYTGFTIYMPDRQYSNAKASNAIATAVFKRLGSFFPISNLPKEDSGVVEDQDLIAIGARNSADAASILIEYGYIYEPQFQDEQIRNAVIKEMALQTYLGLQDFFAGGNDTGAKYLTTLLPRQWVSELTRNTVNSIDVLSLQAALMFQGLYPGKESKNECPLTGNLGPCTLAAISEFQEKYGITGEKNKVGPKTIEKLNELYGK